MPSTLLAAIDSTSHIHLIIGSNPLAASRCTRSLEVGAKPIVIAPPDALVHYGLQKRIDDGQVEWHKKEYSDTDLTSLGREDVDGVVDAVFITSGTKSPSCLHMSNLCRRLRIPVNVADTPSLCTFTLLSTYTDGPLQIGVTTGGKGCKLASRIRREVASSLPPNLGSGCEKLGIIRRRIWEEDHAAQMANGDPEIEDEELGQKATFNKLILSDDREAARGRRMRWLGQICEYWPLRRLAAINDDDVESVMTSYATSVNNESAGIDPEALENRLRKAKIVLAGSGPGNPSLLTVATHRAINSADLILADKLVPAPVLELIPRRTPVHIARKFPGNAEAAQEELLSLGLEALKKGLSVLRLKQGDPYIYGRGGEEYDFFSKAGFIPTVLPGITSALSAPLFARIPATQRAVSDQILICTGTGRKGASPDPPAYNPTQTVVFLMSLHRLESLITSLINSKTPYPSSTPCAVIERASCPDQRVIRSTLQSICAAIEEEGSRPPGLLVVGHSCNVLASQNGRPWLVEEGCSTLDDFTIESGLPGLETSQLGRQAVEG